MYFDISVTLTKMFRHRLTAKLTAFFITAFVCLNAGGALCLGYCQTFDISAGSELSSLEKGAEHCDKKHLADDSSSSIGVAPTEMDCCPVAISFFAAPAEGKNVLFDFPVGLAIVRDFSFNPAIFPSRERSISYTQHRGPPLDQRVNRLKYGVIRI